MPDVTVWSRDLRQLAPQEWPAYLAERSGLPGPRANLRLAQEVAMLADAAVIDALRSDDGEYSMLCAAAAAGRRADDGSFEELARRLAGDERWRVREGVALGLQLLGDAAPAELATLVLRWSEEPDAFAQRAAAAAICEPRLLRRRGAPAVALEVCRRATAFVQTVPASQRRRDDVRVLRQALGYCWSVAVAAAPDEGLDLFGRLDTSDSDVAWIVRENRRKKRFPAQA